jgi:hypothetical protein
MTAHKIDWKKISDRYNLVHHWHPSQNARALNNFLNYAEARVDYAPLKKKEALAALSWLRGFLDPKHPSNK